MSGVLRVNATDPRIPNTGGWFGATNDHTLTCNSKGCKFLLLFRGTGITMYGKTDSLTNGALYLELDGTPGQIPLNGTTFSDGVAPIYHVGNMGDGDHQLMGNVPLLTNGTFLMDYFEVENASGGGFDLLSAGSAAPSVPAQAVIVDNMDPAITYNTDSQWFKYSDGVSDYGSSLSSTFTPGASLSYSFDGVAIWYYGHFCATCGSFNVSIDGLTPQRLNASRSSNLFHLVQRMVWSNTSLDPGRHTITLTHDGNTTSGVFLDFFRVLPGAGTSTPLSSFSTTNLGESPTTVSTTVPATVATTLPPGPPTNQNQSNTVPLAVGLTLGLLTLVAVILYGVRHIYRRRGRKPIDFDALSASPYTGPPIGQANQQSSIPQVRKGAPQPARPPPTPMTTVDPAMGSEPPPSYEAPTHDWRLGTAL